MKSDHIFLKDIALLILAFISFSRLYSQILQPSANVRIVTASDYCDFLNHVAVSDFHFFYDEKMKTDSEVGVIRRSGVPGSYHYEVITGRENFPITFVSENSADAYCKWKQEKPNTLILDVAQLLKSNQNDFEVLISSSRRLSLASSPNSTSNFNSYYSEAIGVAGIIGLAAFGHELMIQPGGEEESSELGSEGQSIASHGATIIESSPKDQTLARRDRSGRINHEQLHSKLRKQTEDALRTTLTENILSKLEREAEEALNALNIISLEENQKISPLEQESEETKTKAQKFKNKAQDADIIAQAAKEKAYENNFEEELNSYKSAEEAWFATVKAYEAVLYKAEAYHNGDPTLWNDLPQVERRIYNQSIERSNEIYTTKSQEKYQQAVKKAVSRTVDFAQRLSTSPWKGSSFGEAKIAVEELTEVTKEEAEKLALIEWGQLKTKDRDEESFIKLIEKKTKELNIARWKNLRFFERDAEIIYLLKQAKISEYHYSNGAEKSIVVNNKLDVNKFSKAVIASKNAIVYLAGDSKTIGATNSLKRAIESSKEGLYAEAAFWAEKSRLYKVIGEYYLLAANDYAQGNEDSVAKWNKFIEETQNEIRFIEFKQAVQRYPDAERLIFNERGDIVPSNEAEYKVTDDNDAEIIKSLISVLQNKGHDVDFITKILGNKKLTGKQLQVILDVANNQRNIEGDENQSVASSDGHTSEERMSNEISKKGISFSDKPTLHLYLDEYKDDENQPNKEKEGSFSSYVTSLHVVEANKKIEEALTKEALDEVDLWKEALKYFEKAAELFDQYKVSINNKNENSTLLSSSLEVHQEGEKIKEFAQKIATANQEIVDEINNSSLRDDWLRITPGERKDRAYNVENNAERRSFLAKDAYSKFIADYNILSQADLIKKREEIYDLAYLAWREWKKSKQIFEIGYDIIKEEAVSDRAKGWWIKQVDLAKHQMEYWFSALSSLHSNKSLDIKELSLEDFHQFPYASLIESQLIENPRSHEKVLVKILKTGNQDPYIRIEEIIDDANSIVNRKVMNASHLLATFKEGDNPEQVFEVLKKRFPNEKLKFVLTSSYQNRYKICFNVTPLKNFSNILKACYDLNIESEPNYLSQVAREPNDIFYRSDNMRTNLPLGQWNLERMELRKNISSSWVEYKN